MAKKDTKTARFGMRVAPDTKERWEVKAKEWGYKSTSEFIEAMTNWAISYDQFSGDYAKYTEQQAAK